MIKLKDFDFTLPDELIAKYPYEKRDEANLLFIDRKNDLISHKKFFNILDYLNKGDVIVLNNTKVIHSRLIGAKKTGAKIEVFVLKKIKDNIYSVLIKPAKRVKILDSIFFQDNFYCNILERNENVFKVEFFADTDIETQIEKVGLVPLPPYIKRDANEEDKKTYQTVYAKKSGSVASPTAGLHWTKELIAKAKEQGINFCEITLSVGMGTFLPVKTEDIEKHKMHEEYFEISKDSAALINRAREKGNNVIACGTTVLRSLESAIDEDGKIIEKKGNTNIFIYPPYKIKSVTGLITNFHLPKSTLLMLVSSFYDRQKILDAYLEAVKQKYKFFSYGDAMFLL